MFKMPQLTPENVVRDFIDVFGGYNHNLRIAENEFYDMKNMSSSCYPLIATRPKRGDIPDEYIPSAGYLGYLCGMLYCSALYVVTYFTGQGAFPLNVYKDGTKIANFSFYDGVVEERRERKLVMMGAYLIIFPDKVYVNVEDPNDFGSIEAEASTNGNTTEIQICQEDGSALEVNYVGTEEPQNPKDGYMWLDPSGDSPILKKYFASNRMWSAVIAQNIKISESDIAADFSEGDGVEISGITAESLTHLNGITILKNKPDDDTLILNARFENIEGIYDIFKTLERYKNRTTLTFHTNHPVTANQYAGKTIIIGGKKVECVSNSDSTAEQGWKRSTTTNLTSRYNTLKSIDSYQRATSPQSVYVQLENGDSINAPSADGTPVILGEGDPSDTEIPTRIISVSNNNPPMVAISTVRDIPANTTIYPLEEGVIDDRYTFTLELNAPVSVPAGTKAALEPDFKITQSGHITISRKMPLMDMELVTESKNRLWGCRYGENRSGDMVNEIYCSKLGDFKNWQCFEGASTDSYAASCGTDGEWTGAINYQGYPVFFKENYIHTIYGNYPAQFQINSVSARGVQKGSHKSLVILNEALFYMSPDGVCTYNGSLPVNISEAFGNIIYKNASACAYKGKYYIHFYDVEESPLLMVFDINRKLWHKEDNISLKVLCPVEDDIYYLDNSWNIYSLFGTGGQSSDPITWYVESGLFGLSSPDSKYISRVNLRLSLDQGSTVSVYIQYDNSSTWNLVGTVTREDINPFIIPILPRRCDHFRLKLEGSGGAKIYSIAKTIDQGSDVVKWTT